MRYTVKRNETAARRAPLVFVALAGVVAAGGVMAAPGLDLGAMPGMARNDDAVRIMLPPAHRAAAILASPTARTAPLPELAAVEVASAEVVRAIDVATDRKSVV